MPLRRLGAGGVTAAQARSGASRYNGGRFSSAVLPMHDTVLTALRGADAASAVEAALTWLKTDTSNPEAHHLLGLALRQAGQPAQADQAFARAIELAPERAPYHLSRALLAAQLGAADLARVGFVEALKHDPNLLMAYVGLAELALSTAQPDAAEQHLRFAERIAPEHPHVESLWARLQLERGQGEAALRRMQRVVERVPDDAPALGVLGLCYLNQGHAAFAEQALLRALDAQPRNRMLRYALINALLLQGHHDVGMEHATILIEQNPNDTRALTLAGQMATDLGDGDTAVSRLSQSLRLAPAQPHALEALLRVHSARGETDAANAFLEELLQAQPQLDLLWGTLINFQGQDVARAAAVAQRWMQARPDSATALEVAAQMIEAQGDLDQAQALAQRAVALEPRSVAAQLVLARREIAAGAAETACQRLAQLRETLTDPALTPLLATWQAHASEAAGRTDDAARYWGEANPEFAAATSPDDGKPH